ncbi:hypothetical protein [Streptomyces phytophilus]|uniref:hypothetical protein n=1 Tax=Streptomyces phytophilus TaxID=722715 RepID=UPI002867F49F|nr:hypothetical protein [Streptomyces phytophilus]
MTAIDSDVTEVRPVERHVDTLLRLEFPDGPTYLLLVEAQTKPDKAKPASWAYYLSYVRNRYGQQPILLVVCRDRTTALWASRPFRIGHPSHPNLTLTPLVLGPHNVPKITDYERAAADVPFAVFSAITHSNDPDAGAILNVLAEALQKTDDETRTICSELASSGLGDTPAAGIWRTLMETGLFSFRGFVAEGLREEGRVEGRVEGREEGRVADGVAKVTRLLEVRGIPVPADAHRRITTCKDPETLDLWFDRAITATTADELFTDPPQD